MDEELIAEGELLSTYPKELVDDIPLGPNAAVVKVTLVVKPDAYLWRPRPSISLMGDAVNETIAWPINRIYIPQPPTRDELIKNTSPKVNFS